MTCYTGKGVFGIKIADKRFINDTGIRGRWGEIRHLPAVFRLVGLEHGNISVGLSCRIGNQIGIGGSRDVLVVGGIQDLVGIRVCNLNCTIHQVLKGILFTRCQIGDGEPVVVAILFHPGTGRRSPVVEITYHEDRLFVGCPKHQSSRLRIRIVDPLDNR